MEIKKITKDYKSDKSSVIALGNFDGVHIGHRVLLETMVKEAEKNNIKSSVLIFKEHTKKLISNKKHYLLTSNEKKYKIFEEMGIDIVYEIPFDKSIMTMSPEYFVKDFLINNLNVRGIVVGFDYRFGYKAMGNAELLEKMSVDYNFKLKVLDPVEKDGEKISSTLIRTLITEGKIEEANQLLGYEYTIDGVVIHGKKLGEKMGYPTANIDPDVEYVIPAKGVYDSDIFIDGKKYKAATNIGKNPTIENSGLRVESHILDFSESIYSKRVSLSLLRYLRPELKFKSVEELFQQIALDTEEVRQREE